MWIDGGLHATEIVGANQLMETSYQLVNRNDEETTRILKDVIVVMVHANPDGMQMVAKCYMQEPVPEKRRGPCSTRLYEKYAGHDNNRDFYMSNLPEIPEHEQAHVLGVASRRSCTTTTRRDRPARSSSRRRSAIRSTTTSIP